ncbi:MAG: PEP/pyruvate-binding domain-containing protein, partial [Bacteroidota bacterium]
MTETVPLLADPADPDPRVWGGKGAALARLGTLGLPVLPVTALTPDAFWASLPEAQALALREAAGPKAAAEALADLSLSPNVEAVLTDALNRLGEADFYAVRSSAPGEDGAADAFAGQLETFLFVPRGEVAHRVADVWRSAFAARVWAYR